MAKRDGNLAGCRAALQAVHNARLAIVQLREERRRVGQWQSGLQYKAAQGGIYDEAQHARRVAAQFRTEHTEVLLKQEELLDQLPEALEISIRQYNELYRGFNRALDVAPI